MPLSYIPKMPSKQECLQESQRSAFSMRRLLERVLGDGVDTLKSHKLLHRMGQEAWNEPFEVFIVESLDDFSNKMNLRIIAYEVEYHAGKFNQELHNQYADEMRELILFFAIKIAELNPNFPFQINLLEKTVNGI